MCKIEFLYFLLNTGSIHVPPHLSWWWLSLVMFGGSSQTPLCPSQSHLVGNPTFNPCSESHHISPSQGCHLVQTTRLSPDLPASAFPTLCSYMRLGDPWEKPSMALTIANLTMAPHCHQGKSQIQNYLQALLVWPHHLSDLTFPSSNLANHTGSPALPTLPGLLPTGGFAGDVPSAWNSLLQTAAGLILSPPPPSSFNNHLLSKVCSDHQGSNSTLLPCPSPTSNTHTQRHACTSPPHLLTHSIYFILTHQII